MQILFEYLHKLQAFEEMVQMDIKICLEYYLDETRNEVFPHDEPLALN